MGRDLLGCIRAAIAWGWKVIVRCPEVAKLFPPQPPPSVRYPLLPGIEWSLTSAVESGALDLSHPVQAIIAQDRTRFANGRMILQVANVASRNASIVARITETGAIRAQHLVVMFWSEQEWLQAQ